MVEEQNLPEGESERRTGPLDLVLEEEVAIVELERERERERARKREFYFSSFSLKGPLGRLVWQT